MVYHVALPQAIDETGPSIVFHTDILPFGKMLRLGTDTAVDHA